MKKFLFIFTGLSGLISVAMGAVAAHALQATFPPERIATITKASEYQILHTLVLLAIALSSVQFTRSLKFAAVFFCAGIILFSGSLYAYVFTEIHALVYITPFGGLSFMAGWLAICLHGFAASKIK